MALFQQQKDPSNEVAQLRSQGLTDNLIMEELTKKGYSPEQVNQAITQLDASSGGMEQSNGGFTPGAMPTTHQATQAQQQDPLYGRMEEIVESLIDEKWDELISEVKKIVEWKEKIEEKQSKMSNDLEKIKEDFKILHQGVLGKLDEYDNRMRDVGTELKAVGKVFKDVVPQFVENVKELSSITNNMKK